MLSSTLLLVLTATPVALQLELPASTVERVRPVLEQRLRDDGYLVTAGARLKLSVEAREGALRLRATLDEQLFERDFTPVGTEWSDALAERLLVLAHETEAAAKASPAPGGISEPPTPLEPPPDTNPDLLAEPPPPAPPPGPAFHISASARVGAMVRVPDVDASMALAASLAGPVVEPMVLMGVVAARTQALTAWETPLTVGARVPFHFGAWHLIPELLVGVRLHSWVPSVIDGGGTRVDFTGLFGLSLLRSLGPFKVGLRLGLDVAPGQQHFLDDELVWSRGTFGFSTQLHFER